MSRASRIQCPHPVGPLPHSTQPPNPHCQNVWTISLSARRPTPTSGGNHPRKTPARHRSSTRVSTTPSSRPKSPCLRIGKWNGTKAGSSSSPAALHLHLLVRDETPSLRPQHPLSSPHRPHPHPHQQQTHHPPTPILPQPRKPPPRNGSKRAWSSATANRTPPPSPPPPTAPTGPCPRSRPWPPPNPPATPPPFRRRRPETLTSQTTLPCASNSNASGTRSGSGSPPTHRRIGPAATPSTTVMTCWATGGSAAQG